MKKFRLSPEEKAEQKRLKKEKLKKRITEIDIIRGVCILVMVLDHMMFDFGYLLPQLFTDYPYKMEFTQKLCELAKKFWYWDVRVNVRYFVLFLFMALTGISCSFSRSNLKRGLQLFGFSLVLTLVTFIFAKMTDDIDNTITFGVIHCISVAIILVALLEKITSNKWVYFAIGIVMTAVGGYILFGLPPKNKFLSYDSDKFIILLLKAMAGLATIGSDCFSLLFYGGQIFIGVFLGKLLYKDRKSLIFKGDYKNNVITFAGRHSLFIYLAHQLVLPLIFGIVLLILGFKLAM